MNIGWKKKKTKVNNFLSIILFKVIFDEKLLFLMKLCIQLLGFTTSGTIISKKNFKQ